MHDHEREVMLDLARVTETAALRAARWMGKGDKETADQAAVDGMRGMFDLVDIRGTVILGEGEKDQAPMLFNGEHVGRWEDGPEVDIAVDPLEGTALVAMGQPNALSVVVAAAHGSIRHLPTAYVEKLAVGPRAAGHVDLAAPVRENLKVIAALDNRKLQDLTVAILDRPRHVDLIRKIRDLGCRIKLMPAGDLGAGVAVALEETGVDVLYGIGGAPEALLTAAALKCLGGDIQVRLYFRDQDERALAEQAWDGRDVTKVFGLSQLIQGDEVIFAATGVTDGDILQGVRYRGMIASTETLLMRAHTGTIRHIRTRHRLDQKTIRSRTQDDEMSL